MRIFNLEIVRHSHYDHLINECTNLAIENVNLNKDLALAEYKVRMHRAETELYECINNELQDRIKHKKAKRDNKGRFSK